MDIYINTTVDIVGNLLLTKGFTIKRKKNHFSAIYAVPWGRYHMLYELIDGEVFCDFHYDNKLHGIGLGADYGKKPDVYFNIYLKDLLEQDNIAYTVKKVNWFTRRNMAIVTGLRM
jgi:hypothetical protein